MLADGTPFLVMELLEGESLGTRLRRTARCRSRPRVDFAYQTASALGAAHAKGIVHRDLKPDNLFLVPDPHDATPRADEGARLRHREAAAGDRRPIRSRRAPGTLMGTPIYMSPEQCRGTRAVDHRSDIYSLGVILYEMLVGQPPFVSEGFGELVNMHLNVPPASARSKRPEIPLALDALVLKMLAKNPEDRYADMAEVQGALKASGGSQFTVRVVARSRQDARAQAGGHADVADARHDVRRPAPASASRRRRSPGCRGGRGKLMIGGRGGGGRGGGGRLPRWQSRRVGRDEDHCRVRSAP